MVHKGDRCWEGLGMPRCIRSHQNWSGRWDAATRRCDLCQFQSQRGWISEVEGPLEANSQVFVSGGDKEDTAVCQNLSNCVDNRVEGRQLVPGMIHVDFGTSEGGASTSSCLSFPFKTPNRCFLLPLFSSLSCFEVAMAIFGCFKRVDGSGMVLVGPRGARWWWLSPNN